MSKTTFDLSTLNLPEGTHTITVKAKAEGYRESDASNAVTYTVAPATAFNLTFSNVPYDEAIAEHVFIQINGTGEWHDILNDSELHEFSDVELFKIYYVPNGTIAMALGNTDGGYPDMDNPTLSQFTFTDNTSADNAQTVRIAADTEVVVTVFATSAFKQIYLIKLDSVNYSAIAQANINKVYTIKDTTESPDTDNYIASIRKNTSGSDPIWEIRDVAGIYSYLKIDGGSSTETTIVFKAMMSCWPYYGTYYHNYIALEGDTMATPADFANFTADSNANLVVDYMPTCFVENTLISTKNGDKLVQDITYEDELLCWNFDEGHLDYAKPIFIKQEQTTDSYWHVTDEDGKEINLVGSNGKSHRLYNKRTRTFEYPQDIPQCKCEQINESVKYYNILTAYHFNCYANGILTSKRYSNMLYPITEQMTYDKSVKHINICKREQFDFLMNEEFEKLRLSEMEYSDEMREEIRNFFALKK